MSAKKSKALADESGGVTGLHIELRDSLVNFYAQRSRLRAKQELAQTDHVPAAFVLDLVERIFVSEGAGLLDAANATGHAAGHVRGHAAGTMEADERTRAGRREAGAAGRAKRAPETKAGRVARDMLRGMAPSERLKYSGRELANKLHADFGVNLSPAQMNRIRASENSAHLAGYALEGAAQ